MKSQNKKSKVRQIILNDEKPETEQDIIFDKPESSEFLADLNNINFKVETEKKEEPIKKVEDKKPIEQDIKPVEIKPKGKARSILNDIINGKPKPLPKIKAEEDELFSDKGSEILGKDKRILISKIQQYKSLFPEVFKKFKIKQNATCEELTEYLEEMDIMVSTDSVEQFLTDSIMQSLKMIEGASSYTKYDISGLTDLLKGNKQFNTLMKQLYIKYKVFSQVPIEYQAILLVSTTAYICLMKNKKKKELEQFLNQPIYINTPTPSEILPPPQEEIKTDVEAIETPEMAEEKPKRKINKTK
jgi:hypothetical protein